MKKCRSLLAGFFVPALTVSGFQQLTSVRRTGRLDIAFAPRASPAVEDSPATEVKETTSELPPVLQRIVDERNEFQLNLGKAMDTLRKDYPGILHENPDFRIYHDNINVVDPSGVQLTGLSNYKHSFTFYQTLIKILYSRRSSLQCRMVCDFARSSIRVSWNAVLHPKVFPLSKPLYVDGISMYRLDAASGKITEHRIEHLLINNTPVAPPYGIFSLIREELAGGQSHGVPVGVGAAMISNDLQEMACWA